MPEVKLTDFVNVKKVESYLLMVLFTLIVRLFPQVYTILIMVGTINCILLLGSKFSV